LRNEIYYLTLAGLYKAKDEKEKNKNVLVQNSFPEKKKIDI